MSKYEVPVNLFTRGDAYARDEALAESLKSVICDIFKSYEINGNIASVSYGPTFITFHCNVEKRIDWEMADTIEFELAMKGFRDTRCVINGCNFPLDIEVPNTKKQAVYFGDLIAEEAFVNAKGYSAAFIIGKDGNNQTICGDLSNMAHLLIGGATRSGKSVFIASLIGSLLCKYSPKQLKLLLIDPKKTEFSAYRGVPHLVAGQVMTDFRKILRSFEWAIQEMERRYVLFEKMSRSGKFAVTIDGYNELVEDAEKLPRIVVIVDELADLTLIAREEIDNYIVRLAQKSRAAGIHLVLASQRPTADVFTEVIRSNMYTRFAFSVPCSVDSRIVLDQTGAQKLLGMGDLLYKTIFMREPLRVQCAYISNSDTFALVSYIKKNCEDSYDEGAAEYVNEGEGGEVEENEAVDPRYIEVLRTVIQTQTVSISYVQRKFQMGYSRAGKAIEWMEEMGYITPFDGAKVRKVLITMEEFNELYGDGEKGLFD